MATVNLRSFRRQAKQHSRQLRRFLAALKKHPPRGLQTAVEKADAQVWKSLDCLDCANCCKTMSPTYSRSDVLRISKHLGMGEKEFRKKWLYRDGTGDWLNRSTPCQFLDRKTHLCNIYAVRPRDCAGFPHHGKKKMVDYIHVFQQNVTFCPATYRMVEQLMESASALPASKP